MSTKTEPLDDEIARLNKAIDAEIAAHNDRLGRQCMGNRGLGMCFAAAAHLCGPCPRRFRIEV